jgi:hypothetical protein
MEAEDMEAADTEDMEAADTEGMVEADMEVVGTMSITWYRAFSRDYNFT